MNAAHERLLNLVSTETILTESESEVVVNTRPLRRLGNESIVNIVKSDEAVLEAILKNFYIENDVLYKRTKGKPIKVSLKKSDNNMKARVKIDVTYGRTPVLSFRNVVYMLTTKACIPLGKVVKLKEDDDETSLSSLVFSNMYLEDSADTNNIFSLSVPEKTPERFTGLASIRRLPDVFAKNSNFQYKQYAGHFYLVNADNTIDYRSFHKDWRVVLNQKLSVGVWYMPMSIVMPKALLNLYWIKEIYDTLWSLDIAPGYHINTIVFEAEEAGKERVYTWRPSNDALLPIYTKEYNATSIPDNLYFLCVSEEVDPNLIFMSDYTAYTSDSDVKREFKKNQLAKMGDHVYDHLRIELYNKLKESGKRDIPEWLKLKPRETVKYYSTKRDFSLQNPQVTYDTLAYLKTKARNNKHMNEMLLAYFGNTKTFPMFDVEETGLDMQTGQPRSEKDLMQYRKVVS